MALFSVERTGILDCYALVSQLMVDLEANGFTRKFPAAVPTPIDHIGVYEAGATVDGNSATQPWRIRLQAIDESKVVVHAATPLQLPSDGTLTFNDDGKEWSGHLGIKTALGDALVNADTIFINRANLDVNQRASSPMSYRLTISSHGIALFVWEPGNDNLGNNQSWFNIQRLVNNTSGAPRMTGKSPVICLFGIKHVSQGVSTLSPTVDVLKRLVVREADISRPTVAIDAGVDSSDAARVVNTNTMVAITEDNNYVISFPNNITTQRFAYPSEELDIIAYTSADVISQNSDVSVTVYGELSPRVYKAMSANGPDNTGMRILLLASGGAF